MCTVGKKRERTLASTPPFFPGKASFFFFVLLPSPPAPSLSPNEQANLSCALSGGFCGFCSGRACLFFIMALVQGGSTKDHGTWSSKHRLSMRHVSLLDIRNFSGRMLLSFSRDPLRGWFILPPFYFSVAWNNKKKFKFCTNFKQFILMSWLECLAATWSSFI